MSLTEKLLAAAKCGRHSEYQPDCHLCVWRYMDKLIADDYVPRHVYESVVAERNYQRARGNSLQAEIDWLTSELERRSGGRVDL